MKAIRVHEFGPPEVMQLEDLPDPVPASDEVVVKVSAAGVGPWDAWIRAGRSALPQPLPLTLGSDLSGTVVEVGRGVKLFKQGDDVFGVTNSQFTGAYAQLAVAKITMIAPKPQRSSFVESASIPVVAVTAWQMLSRHAQVKAGQYVLVLGAGGNVGSFVVQFAHRLQARVIAVVSSDETARVRDLGADEVVSSDPDSLSRFASQMDAVIDLVGGTAQEAALVALKPGGVLISAVSKPDSAKLASRSATGKFILVDVNTACLTQIAESVDSGELRINVGRVLSLKDARLAHEILEGVHGHLSGKIVLDVLRSIP